MVRFYIAFNLVVFFYLLRKRERGRRSHKAGSLKASCRGLRGLVEHTSDFLPPEEDGHQPTSQGPLEAFRRDSFRGNDADVCVRLDTCVAKHKRRAQTVIFLRSRCLTIAVTGDITAVATLSDDQLAAVLDQEKGETNVKVKPYCSGVLPVFFGSQAMLGSRLE